MNRRMIGVLAFALAVASLTTLVVYRLVLSHLQAPASAVAVSPSKLFVAARDLQPGTLIKDSDVIEREWPGTPPQQAVRTKEQLMGRGVIAPIFENEPFLEQRLASKGAGGGLASTIPVGMRAIAVPVNDVVSLAGFVVPGMHVDVLVAGDAPGDSSSGRRCKTVLQNIEVLSVGQNFEKNPEGKPQTAEVVNLLVTPDQAEALNLASSEAKVQLVLRNPMDTEERGTHGSSVASLFGQEPPLARPKPASPGERKPTPASASSTAAIANTSSIEMFVGGHKTDQVVAAPGGMQ